MKTIFISSFHPLISRNIFATTVPDLLLAEGNVRIVVVCPERSRKYFAEEYGRERVIVRGVDTTLSFWDVLLRHLSLAALGTRSVAIKRAADMKGRGALLSFFTASSWGARIVRLMSRLCTPRGAFDALFREYVPATVFVTDVQNEFDVRLMHGARRHGIPLVGMVRSWDNLTIKGLLRVAPDLLLVQNDLSVSDAVSYHGILRDTIRVVGIPHYDAYRARAVCDRQALVAKFGLLKKRIIVYVATGDRYLQRNAVDCKLLEVLASFRTEEESIIVRMPIADTVACLSQAPADGGIHIEQVDKTRFANRKFVELSRADDEHLQNLLRCADIVVTGPSTICVDAALFDRPVILVGFDGGERRQYYDSIRRYYDYNHFAQILGSGGVAFVKNQAELRDALSAYRVNPALHAEGRKRIVREQAGSFSGTASRKLADELLAFIRQ